MSPLNECGGGGGGGGGSVYFTGLNYRIGTGPGNVNAVWDDSCTYTSPVACRGWSDYYPVVYQTSGFTVQSTGGSKVCDGCWSIQFNTQAGNSQLFPTPTYQFLLVIEGYNWIHGFIEMVLPNSSNCPVGWSPYSTDVVYCGYATSSGYSSTGFASAGLTFTIQPVVDSGGYVDSVSFSATGWAGDQISIPSGYSYRYQVGQVNIVGDGNSYPNAAFSFTNPGNTGTIWFYGQSGAAHYGMNSGSDSMYGSTAENSNVGYSGGVCPCGSTSNEGWG